MSAIIVQLGNAAPIDVHKEIVEKDGEQIEVIHRIDRGDLDLGAQVCEVQIPEDHVTAEDLDAVAGHPRWGPQMRGLPVEQREFYLHRGLIDDLWWTGHSNDPPEWVECEDHPVLAQLIADHFTTAMHTCRVGRPSSWEEGRPLPEDYAGRGSGGLAGAGLPEWQVRHRRDLRGLDDVLALAPDLRRRWPLWDALLADEVCNLRTNGGTDAALGQHLGTAAQPAAFNYIALTANATAASASDTTLTAEIATASGGLIRKQGAYAHTNGTNTATLSATFTANGNDSLPVTIAKFGIFNASSSGTMGYETVLSTSATLSASGDNMALTDTFTLS